MRQWLALPAMLPGIRRAWLPWTGSALHQRRRVCAWCVGMSFMAACAVLSSERSHAGCFLSANAPSRKHAAALTSMVRVCHRASPLREMQVSRRLSLIGSEKLLNVKALSAVQARVTAMGSLGHLLFVLLFAFSQLLVVVPVSPMLIAAAILFEAPVSYILVSMGVLASAVGGFFLARFGIRPQVQRLFEGNKKFQRISAAVEQQGFKIALLSRLSLVLPTAPMTFVFGGLTDIHFGNFFAATLLGSIPEAWATVYLTVSARGMLQHHGGSWYFYAVAMAAVALLVHTIAKIANRALDTSIQDSGKD